MANLPLTISGSSNSTSSSVIVDALPYIDSEYDDPGMRETVLQLIETEKRRMRPQQFSGATASLPPLDLTSFLTPLLTQEFSRIASNKPLEMLSMKRYELPPPPAGKLTDLQAWNECVDNSCAQLEHQNVRLRNLQLMLDFGTESWKSYLEVSSRMVTQAQKQLADIKKSIQEINWSRKQGQTDTGTRLQQLEASWVGLVSKNYEIEGACLALEAEIAALQNLKNQRQSESYADEQENEGDS